MTQQTKTRSDEILDLFRGFREPPTNAALTARCVENGLWQESERDALFFKAAQSEVRRVLSKAGEDGLPAALVRVQMVRNDEGSIERVNVLLQKQLWTKVVVRDWITSRVKAMKDDWTAIEAVINHAELRWPNDDWRALVPEIEWPETEE